MIKHIKIRKTNWTLTIFFSILIGLFINTLILGVIGIFTIFGNPPIIKLPSELIPTNLFLFGWVLFSAMAFVILKDEIKYEKIEHEEEVR